MAQATSTKPLEVELMVCPVCRSIDKLAGASHLGVKGFCVGPMGKGHKRARREPAQFKEVVSEQC
jgi:hypothetical protein